MTPLVFLPFDQSVNLRYKGKFLAIYGNLWYNKQHKAKKGGLYRIFLGYSVSFILGFGCEPPLLDEMRTTMMSEPTASYIDMGNLKELTLLNFVKTDSFQKFMRDFGLTKVGSGRVHICTDKTKKLLIYHGMGSIGWSGFGIPAIINNEVTHLVAQMNEQYTVIRVHKMTDHDGNPLDATQYKGERIMLTGQNISAPEALKPKTKVIIHGNKDIIEEEFRKFLGGNS